MKRSGPISDAQVAQVIDPRAVPVARVHWPAAFRLKPARMPDTDPFEAFSEDVGLLHQLKDLTSPARRHQRGEVPLPVPVPVGVSATVLSAFACSLPEWRFAARATVHMALADSIGAAIDVAAEIYSQFMKDTGQRPSTLSFVVERFSLQGNFADITEVDVFPACYDKNDYRISQQLVADIGALSHDGVLYGAGGGMAAIVLSPEAITGQGVERAVALQWDGACFSRVFDYRDVYWRDL